jgi:hypothetical protein
VLFPPIWKPLIKVEHEHQDTHDEILFQELENFFLTKLSNRKSAVQVYLFYYSKLEDGTDFWLILRKVRHRHNWVLALDISCTCNTAARKLQNTVSHVVRLAREALLAHAGMLLSGRGSLIYYFEEVPLTPNYDSVFTHKLPVSRADLSYIV